MKLTWKEAYRAAYGFLDAIWKGVREEEQELLAELDLFLGDMMPLEDGLSANPAFAELWHQASAQVTGGNGYGDLSGEQAYQVMKRFLRRWAVEHSDGTVLGICEELDRTGPDREGWTEAVTQVAAGNFDPYFGLTEEK